MSLRLTGLNGSNPMGFLAGLGVLVAGKPSWRLAWCEDGTWSALLDGPPSQDRLIAELIRDRKTWGREGLLAALGDLDDIRMPATRFRRAAEDLLGTPTAEWLAPLASEVVLDGKDQNVKPTALHFTTGQQRFLQGLREIRGYAGPGRSWAEQFRTALFGAWTKPDRVMSFRWDAEESRDYALRFANPSGDGRLTEAGAEWLAFRGLRALPSAPRQGRLATACVGGGWKTGCFRWPLWQYPAALPDVEALLLRERLAALAPAQRRLLGLLAVFMSRIHRSAQGGYGSFAPARPAHPEDDPR